MKILLIIALNLSVLFASELNVKNLEKQVQEAKNNKHIQEYMKNDKTNDLNSFFKQIPETLNLLDKEGSLQTYLENQTNKQYDIEENQKQFKSFKIFYFITEDTSKDLIKNFSYEIQKIKELDENIEALVLTNGLIGGSFDKMAEFVKGLQDFGIKKINIGFNPWAYEYFKLDRVPAYALSYCDKNNYRFKTCKHKFLAKGEISLTQFFEIVSDEENGYKKYYQKLIEAK
ncbi:TrbC family F-type conjugative pilus assembly protein [Aliarcobacter butzleri]